MEASAHLPPCVPACVCVFFADVGVERGGGLVAVDVQMCIMLKGCEWGGVT